jgi:energy-coupling factor transporter ATP-binding protein EcfA2
MMKLVKFQVAEYRSVWSSGNVQVGDVTCLVGKNEAGKTALLRALYKINPIIDSDGRFDVTDDYPRQEVGDYRHEVDTEEREPATVITAVFELEDTDIAAVSEVFGPKALQKPVLTLFKGYSNERRYSLEFFDEKAAALHLASRPDLPDDLRGKLSSAAGDWKAFAALLAAAEATGAVNELKALVNSFINEGASHHAWNAILKPRTPQFLFFDEYFQLTGRENVGALLERQKNGTLKSSDYPLLGLIGIARLDLGQLMNTKRTNELTNTLEGASNHLSRRILKYWSQNKHLQLKFDVREAKPEDPENMRQGVNIWGKVFDTVHWATTEMGSRSRGFVWFFSFLAWYEDIKRKGSNVILLLDEPGLSLHGKAQADFLRYIEEELKPHHQVIYTTHSPFMVDAQHFDRVRIVQDASIDATDALPKEQAGTKVLTDVFAASADSLFPLQGALGYEIQQTLFVGPNCLVVEGPADLLYLSHMSALLEREGRVGLDERWTVTPVGGSSKVPTFVALLGVQKGLSLAALLDVSAGDRPSIEDLYKKKLITKQRVLTYADFTGKAEADVEDMFDRKFYVGLVNAEFATQLTVPVPHPLKSKHPRVLVAIEEHLTANPLKSGVFGHFRPARYLAENMTKLAKDIDASTRDRFEAAFKALNALLPAR